MYFDQNIELKGRDPRSPPLGSPAPSPARLPAASRGSAPSLLSSFFLRAQSHHDVTTESSQPCARRASGQREEHSRVLGFYSEGQLWNWSSPEKRHPAFGAQKLVRREKPSEGVMKREEGSRVCRGGADAVSLAAQRHSAQGRGTCWAVSNGAGPGM